MTPSEFHAWVIREMTAAIERSHERGMHDTQQEHDAAVAAFVRDRAAQIAQVYAADTDDLRARVNEERRGAQFLAGVLLTTREAR